MAGAETATVVLVHGAWHGAWCWRHVTAGLEKEGVRAVTLTLPSVDPTQPGGLAADADAVRATLDRVGGPVVLCGHSYGGAVITEAGDHPAVRRLVYLSGFAMDRGETVLALAESEIAASAGEDHIGPAMRFSEDRKRVSLDLELAVPLVYGESPAEDVELAAAHVATQAAASFQEPVTRVAWRTKPSTFVICTRDRTITPALLRWMAKRCDDTVELDTDHSPFFSRVPETVRILADAARNVGAAQPRR